MNRSSAGLEGQLLVRTGEAAPHAFPPPVTDWACVDGADAEPATKGPSPRPADPSDDLVVEWQLPHEVDPEGRWG